MTSIGVRGMRPTRRSALRFLSLAMGAPFVRSEALRSAELPGGAIDSILPFSRNGATKPGREVFAHWHFYMISMDNRPSDKDYYAVDFLNPETAPGKYRAYGSVLRNRPLPRPPRTTSAWAVADMEQDISWARDIGIDAFLYNIITIDPKAPFWQALRWMLEAAGNVEGPFRIAPNIDAVILANTPASDVAAALKSISDHPMLLRRTDGRIVLGAFAAEAWPAQKWTALFDLLEKANVTIEFMPTFLNIRGATPGHLKLAAAISEWSGNYLDAVGYPEFARAIAQQAGKPWCAPVWPQDFRPKDGVYGEAANSRLFREAWRAAIESSADRVQIITWNDYSESSAIRPSTGIQYAFYDLAAYYIAWFKTGQAPKITRDALYYFYRIQPTDGAELGTAQSAPIKRQWGQKAVNDIELLAFLVDDGELQIEIDGELDRMSAGAGLTSMRVPLKVGRPSFRLKRGDRTVIDLEGAFAITDRAQFQDLLYHGGSSSRAAVVVGER